MEGDYYTNSLPQTLGSKEDNLGISLVVLKRNCSSYELDRRKLYRKKNICQLKNVKEKNKIRKLPFYSPSKNK